MSPSSWRSLLFVPVNSKRFVDKAHQRGADAIILDLEDAIAAQEKEAARAALPGAAKQITQAGTDVTVRINRPLELAVPDITAAVMPQVKALMLPKVMGPEHVKLLSEVVTARELALGMDVGHTRFIGVVETAAALAHLHAIAAADARMLALGLGPEDLCTQLQAVPGGDSLYPFAMQVVAACRAAGIEPLGTVGQFADFSDLQGYRAALRRSRGLGFSCTACIHPSQVPIVNEEYSVSEEEAGRARRLIAAFEDGIAQGSGAVAFEGAMIDRPVVDRARALLARAGRG
ncbi:MAG: CoA ester lyase [Gammaproteobacteria bacterium]|nr:CoA ester lyase [Gammaproteobacteria bacterium]